MFMQGENTSDWFKAWRVSVQTHRHRPWNHAFVAGGSSAWTWEGLGKREDQQEGATLIRLWRHEESTETELVWTQHSESSSPTPCRSWSLEPFAGEGWKSIQIITKNDCIKSTCWEKMGLLGTPAPLTPASPSFGLSSRPHLPNAHLQATLTPLCPES